MSDHAIEELLAEQACPRVRYCLVMVLRLRRLIRIYAGHRR